jgi:hypothetical protein
MVYFYMTIYTSKIFRLGFFCLKYHLKVTKALKNIFVRIYYL